MKIIVFGATGNTGRMVLEQGVRGGNEMTAFVRNAAKLYEQQASTAQQLKVIEDDILNPISVGEALSHQDVAIIAAGNAGQGEEFVRLVDNIISQCESNASFSGRVWVMGGAGLLDIPHTNFIGNNLPGFPPAYKNHNRNYERLLQSELDWSVMCPGTMINVVEPSAPFHLNITTDTLPLLVPSSIKEFSETEIAGYLFSRLEELNVAYDDVVACMLEQLTLEGPYKRKRVGLAYRSDSPVG
ncbi:NAD(P)-dependent oxidoreductase [Paenibacillus glycanilyticus]|uniref:NAD(P)-binding domain-containing protein n=1 Tax=Paenibacillus glycanilyticus TaxID=126569 RepID=A0ABQ6GBN4_9BACL|nr:NAD(P)H-binding protein [Paenibacillus glycanilyticus]GLX67920.1 hypothetical protein MU1_22650 [Paenibacillus glycanilyticus]